MTTPTATPTTPTTPIIITIYDLLPPGRLSSALWFFGASLLHTGIILPHDNREYAFGGHSIPHVTGVYSTPPYPHSTPPPDAVYRQSITHAHTTLCAAEIDAVVLAASQEFLGTSYNLLERNCNHFTDYLCVKLTGVGAPTWINRAAGIGGGLPVSVLPLEWLEPEWPEDEEVEQGNDWRRVGASSTAQKTVDAEGTEKSDETARPTVDDETDAGGRPLPPAERTRLDRTVGGLDLNDKNE